MRVLPRPGPPPALGDRRDGRNGLGTHADLRRWRLRELLVLADDLDLGNGVVIPADEVTVRFSRSSGPGGQNVNRRATRAAVTFDLVGSPSIPGSLKRRARRRLANRLDANGRIRIAADDERTQGANRDAAMERLRGVLREAMAPPPKPRRPTRPSRAARERRITEKKRRGETKRRRSTPARDD